MGEGRTADTRTPVNIAQLEVARLGKERQVEKEGLQTLAHLLTCPVRSRASWEGEAGGEGRTADTRTPVNMPS